MIGAWISDIVNATIVGCSVRAGSRAFGLSTKRSFEEVFAGEGVCRYVRKLIWTSGAS